MTRTQFTEKMTDVWIKTNRNVLDMIERKLSYYSEDDIHALWVHTTEHYNQQSAPTYAHICTFIIESGIKQSKFEARKRYYVYVCLECGQVYADRQDAKIAICCPKCLSMRRSIDEYSDDKYLNKVKTYQWKCFLGNDSTDYQPYQCLMFNQSGCSGPSCFSWGIQKNTKDCRDCICEECCDKQIAESKSHVQREKKYDVDRLAKSSIDKHSI